MGAAAAGAEVEDTIAGTEPDMWVLGKEEHEEKKLERAVGLDRPLSDESTAGASEPPRAPSTEHEKQLYSEENPSFASLMYGEVRGGPRPEHFLLRFFAHLEPALKDMARAIGEKWLAAGGHTGTEVNPNTIEVEPMMFGSSDDSLFQEVLKEGFTIECIKAMVGPPSPMTLFKFRHVGKFTGIYTDEDGRSWQGEGQMLDITGVCHIMRNPATNQVIKVDCYYNHLSVIKSIVDPSWTA